jgi:hypothetical protein
MSVMSGHGGRHSEMADGVDRFSRRVAGDIFLRVPDRILSRLKRYQQKEEAEE